MGGWCSIARGQILHRPVMREGDGAQSPSLGPIVSGLIGDVDEFGVNHVGLAVRISAAISAVRGRRLGAGTRGSGLVHGFSEFVAGGGKPA